MYEGAYVYKGACVCAFRPHEVLHVWEIPNTTVSWFVECSRKLALHIPLLAGE